MFSFFYTKIHLANEIIIYADSINYDSEKNIIAKGNAKIIKKVGLNEQILTSDLIIINDVTNELTLPIDFQYRDEGKNYYYGSSGKFSSNLDTATINDVKMLLNDGSRIVGKKGFKTGKIDLINKATSGLNRAKNLLGNLAEISVVEFDHKDVVRHPLVSKIVKAYEDVKS